METVNSCKTCPFWQAGCTLIRENRLAALLENGACKPWDWVARWIGRFLSLRGPGAEAQKEDLLQDLQVFLRRPAFAFPADFTPDALHLRRYLRTVVGNRAHDFLRKEKVAPKLRCGACLYFNPARQCVLTSYLNGGGTQRPHPHYEKVLDPHTNPKALKPPCGQFFWRYRPVELEALHDPGRSSQALKDLEAREAQGILLSALASLMASGPTGRRQGYTLKAHFLSGKTAVAIAQTLGVHEKTTRRDMQSGLIALKLILKDQFHIQEADLL